ncbi:MAG: cupin domain-containing protein [Candidatus Krumholzibacteriota bacterium]
MSPTEFPAFIKANPEVAFPFGGVRGWMITSDRQQTVFVEFTETVEVPQHTHADQWEMVISGRAELHRNGGTEIFGPGDNFFVPAGQPHAATVHEGYRAVIVFAAADRYRAREEV